jgi:hypothetical protein
MAFVAGVRPARQARALALLAGALAGCALPSSGSAPAAPPLTGPVSAPQLRPGDRWVYEWTSGTDKGTKTVEIVDIRDLNGVRYYVVRVSDVDHHYLTMDLHWAANVREGKVEARMVPPQPWFQWPLEAGRRWTHRAVFEAADSRQERQDAFAVIGPESVEVPAGRFSALKLVREGGQRDSDEYWYVPEIRGYVRWVGRRDGVQFEERLRLYQPAPRLIPGSSPPASPPKSP